MYLSMLVQNLGLQLVEQMKPELQEQGSERDREAGQGGVGGSSVSQPIVFLYRLIQKGIQSYLAMFFVHHFSWYNNTKKKD